MSVAQFKSCPQCGQQVHASAKICPKCGHRKKLRWFHWVFIGLAGLLVISMLAGEDSETNTSSAGSPSAVASEPAATQAAATRTQIPEGQQRFVDTVTSFSKDFREAKNELQQSATRSKRARTVAGLGLGHVITGWVGTIKNMETTSDGKAALTVDIGQGVELHTWNNTLSDMMAETLIDPASPLYETLSSMARGQEIIFSGTFLPSEMDFYEESSLTIDGSMSNPEYVFKFSTIGTHVD